MKRAVFSVLFALGAPSVMEAADRYDGDADWSGPAIGSHFSYAGGRAQTSITRLNAAPAVSAFDILQTYNAFKGTGSYAVGLSAGHSFMPSPRAVMGFEADVSFPNTIEWPTNTSAQSAAGFKEAVLSSGTIRGRLGYAPGHWLFYATGGLAWSYNEVTLSPTLANESEKRSHIRLGTAWGIGVELALTPNWSAKFEYLNTIFGSRSVGFSNENTTVASTFAIHAARLGLNYRFTNEDRPLSEVGLRPWETDRFSLRGQTTYLQQYAPPFRSPYMGTNSLAPNQTRQTWDVTLYAGFRPWEGGEFWINPEIDQGFGLSSTVGVAGFPSGEAYKVGAAAPYARIPRAFFRQTINLGGETKKIDGDINQFAGTQASDRLVVTIGKFSVTDVFDTNKYAHDPRKDFMNWSVIDTGTFDYAADAWGFTYGAAVEWYKGPWTFRGGIFDLSTVPNSTELDPTFSQFQWIGEVERRYEIWGKPGKLAVTGFLSRGRMGRFDDAVALSQATGLPASTALVRQYRSRSGISVNLEQEVTKDLGLFARAGVADGSVESYDFTDIDTTVAAGLSLAGSAWNRPNDTFGLAGVVNGISSARKTYLNAGGLGILVGDGRLPQPGQEKILESYYSFPVLAWRATLNYQLIANPAYNRERGPVSVLGVRMRAQF